MTVHVFPVRIAGSTFSADEQVATNPLWVKQLAFGHRKEVTYCLCDREELIPLVIRHYSTGRGLAHYGLARWKGTNWEHHAECRFFSEHFEDGRSSRVSAAFRELENGCVRVHLSRPLGLSADASSARSSTEVGAVKRARAQTRGKASDSALFNRVWRVANLNMYRGKDCTWFNGSLRFLHAASKFVVRKSGESLADFLLVGAPSHSRNAQAHNGAVLERGARHPSRLYLLARLKAPTQAQLAKETFLLPLQDFAALPKVLIKKAQLDRFLDTRAFARASLSNPDANVICLFCIEPGSNGWWHCVDVAALVASNSLIPVESSYELEMERYLIRQSRIFVKPLHGEENETTGKRRPDFLLLATKPRTAVEVWGMSTSEYLDSKAARINWYHETRIPLVSWNAVASEHLPVLPPPRP
ncbi:DUF1173 family protein [Noviherbaspirillum malthae]|uniref:DUF1173 family protein n=1 Tax=Noviherbaspirillum malthae TaxID=1260987 RepID=UPI00188F3418|nr:DUF1173 family protein [Noviherbaspirillum malthae]